MWATYLTRGQGGSLSYPIDRTWFRADSNLHLGPVNDAIRSKNNCRGANFDTKTHGRNVTGSANGHVFWACCQDERPGHEKRYRSEREREV